MNQLMMIAFPPALFSCSSSPIQLVLDHLASWKLRNEEDATEGAGEKSAEEQQPGPEERFSPPHSPVKSVDLSSQYVGTF